MLIESSCRFRQEGIEMKTLYSFQEEGWRIESDQTSVVTIHPECGLQ